MELLEAQGGAMDGFDRVVGQIVDDQWQNPTPCAEWSVRDLLNHLVYEQLWAPWILRGATLDEVGDRFDGDVLGDDPIGAWTASSAAALAAFTKPGALDQQVHVSVGLIDAREYGWQMTMDLAVHGWDLARGIDVPQPIGDELAAQLLELVRPNVDQWQDFGIFAPPVPVSDDATPVAKLVAILGRDPG